MLYCLCTASTQHNKLLRMLGLTSCLATRFRGEQKLGILHNAQTIARELVDGVYTLCFPMKIMQMLIKKARDERE